MQMISPNGEKRFSLGTVKSGNFFPFIGSKGVLYICEGYATGATIFKATKKTVFCAMDCANISHVAKVARKRYPHKKIIIAADNDQYTEENLGIDKAKSVASSEICYVTWPEFKPEDQKSKPTDFNDYFILYGLESTKTALETLWKPTPEIFITEGKLPDIVDRAEKALILLSTDIYRFGSVIVKPVKNNKGEKLRVIESIALQEELTRICQWKRWDVRSEK
jgi:putative DNA primase/helicase